MSSDLLLSKQSLSFFAVELIGLSHRYNSYLAVDQVSFEIKAGTIFGLIGPNGAGKSTMSST